MPVGDYLFNTTETTGFNRFYQWNDVQMRKLFPTAREAQRMLEDKNREDHSDEAGELAFAAQQFGFTVGVLVGMKSAGVSREELTRRAEGCIFPAIESARDRAESDLDKPPKDTQG